MAQFRKHPKTTFISFHCLLHFFCFRASRWSSLICITATSFLSLLIHFLISPIRLHASSKFHPFLYICRSSAPTSQVTQTDAQCVPAVCGLYLSVLPYNHTFTHWGAGGAGVGCLAPGHLKCPGTSAATSPISTSSLRQGLKVEMLKRKVH